ncbi:hypothetical protein OG780_41450 [Streptomyces sp. NBC_00386]|uniref:hypothetical protein n=1 Tax=Streptomyces sp. NBC_00386 TaxID=2975734 RepID=UPI002E1CAE22
MGLGILQRKRADEAAAYCDSDRYPYRAKLYGTWGVNSSNVYASNCYISKVWGDVG